PADAKIGIRQPHSHGGGGLLKERLRFRAPAADPAARVHLTELLPRLRMAAGGQDLHPAPLLIEAQKHLPQIRHDRLNRCLLPTRTHPPLPFSVTSIFLSLSQARARSSARSQSRSKPNRSP